MTHDYTINAKEVSFTQDGQEIFKHSYPADNGNKNIKEVNCPGNKWHLPKLSPWVIWWERPSYGGYWCYERPGLREKNEMIWVHEDKDTKVDPCIVRLQKIEFVCNWSNSNFKKCAKFLVVRFKKVEFLLSCLRLPGNKTGKIVYKRMCKKQ